MQRAHTRFPSGLLKVSVKRRRRGKIVVFTPVKYFLDQMKTKDDEVKKIILYVITVEEDLYKDEAEKDEVRSATSWIAAFTLNLEETVLRTRMQVMNCHNGQHTQRENKFDQSWMTLRLK